MRWPRRKLLTRCLNSTRISRGFRPPTAGATLDFDLRCKTRGRSAVRLDPRSAKSEYRRRIFRERAVEADRFL